MSPELLGGKQRSRQCCRESLHSKQRSRQYCHESLQLKADQDSVVLMRASRQAKIAAIAVVFASRQATSRQRCRANPMRASSFTTTLSCSWLAGRRLSPWRRYFWEFMSSKQLRVNPHGPCGIGYASDHCRDRALRQPKGCQRFDLR